jgi:hypothetical protein
MKYWEVIADNLSKAGWSWGCQSEDFQGFWCVNPVGDGNGHLVQHDGLITSVRRVSLKSGRPTPLTRSREKSRECGLAARGLRLKSES